MIGLILSSKKVGVGLQAIFGDISPTQLPVGGCILNDLQIGFLNQFCDSVKTLVIDDLTSCGDSTVVGSMSLLQLIKHCVKKYGREDDLLILYGDTLFEGLTIPTSNFLSSNLADDKYDWHYFDKSKYVFSGLMRINKGTNIDQEVKSLSCFIEHAVNHNFNLYSDLKWLDFGSYSSYFKNKKILFQIREHNQLETKGKFLVKRSSDIFQLFCQFSWLNDFGLADEINVPTVTDFKIKKNCASYLIKYHPLPTLSELFVHGNNNGLVVDKCLRLLRKQLDVWGENKRRTSLNFISTKLEERRKEIRDVYDRHGIDGCAFENDYRRVSVIASDWPLMEVVGHGDLCLSNIMYDVNSDEIFLIDPRGHFGEEYSRYVPEGYDILKLAHSL
ncbi:hypothetical protein N9005_05535, partial [Akkermansiaceae bacterium]|nr:hypothetical protein [Akkermansiaceae bacterium]